MEITSDRLFPNSPDLYSCKQDIPKPHPWRMFAHRMAVEDLREPIGLGKLKETSKGLEIAGELVLETGKAQEAYALLKRRVLKGLSIGYDVVKDTIANGVRHLHELKLYEVSLVTLPMNELATITDLKAQGGNELAMFREMLRDCAAQFRR
jgi:HK97 family phage prohead protease